MRNETIANLIAIIAIAIVLLCPGLVATASTTPASEPTLPPGYTWYHDEEFSFKIGYPEDWTIVPTEEITLGEGILGIAHFTPEIPGTTLQVWVLSEYDMEGFKAMGGKDVVINGREGYEVIFQPMPPVKIRQIVFEVDDRYYSIICSTTEELYDEYTEVFDNAINSFVIEYPAPVTPTPTPEEDVPGFGAVFAIAGLLAVAYLLRRRG